MGTENASDGRYSPERKAFVGATASQVKKISPIDNQDTSARRRSSVGSNENRTSPAMFRKLDTKKRNISKLETAAHGTTYIENDEPFDGDEKISRIGKPEIKRALFNEDYDKQKHRVVRSDSPVGPGGEASIVYNNNDTGDVCRNQRNCQDLSLIRNQLVQIENQQSSLLEILQRFIGSSQNGIHSLEARVHGLELALDEISFDLAVSNGRMSQKDALCCKLPGTDFLSSKLWRKTEASAAGVRSIAGRSGDGEGIFPLHNRRYRFRGAHGLVMNPLAEISRSSSRILPEVSSSGVA
ncbi:hypothetical protein MIMGU_mgv1a010965mg [Erythranthe guttata]|uniref:Uncharacterized protein n=1 Tax=Erythranthe guttata TaxID=4155 RepID=A0A022RR16_ERYGU|nr:PREDICTED: uncharacterized protein LOC105952178 [Erythranthe guttata]EYU42499.1 hypothetical protein MIMGU_mgv1a010965mg [Erythranthe guttata]|eukprot:XP_012831152.1 PREDICTED: uncharacterized protein LOC105952178 [Erythranthe guttata]